MVGQPSTTVIIPTLAHRPRELLRAIGSVNAQHSPAVALVVLNGQRFNPDLVAALEVRRDIRLLRTPVGSVSKARRLGLDRVDTPAFAFLDDDDELLPEATEVRLPALLDDSADMVATNGYRLRSGERMPMFDMARCTADAARDLLVANWMHSAGASYSTARVPAALFDDLGDLMEVTRFTLRISLGLRVLRLDVPSFVVHEDADQRASQSRKYVDAIPDVLRAMQEETPRPDLRRMLARLRGDALHACSNVALDAGELRRAWQLHAASLTAPGGLKYITYSRHILRAAMFSS